MGTTPPISGTPNPFNLTPAQLAALSPDQLAMYNSVGWYDPTASQIAANYNAGQDASVTGPVTPSQLGGDQTTPAAAPAAQPAAQPAGAPSSPTSFAQQAAAAAAGRVAPGTVNQGNPYLGSSTGVGGSGGGGLPAGYSGLPSWLQQFLNIPNLPGFAPTDGATPNPPRTGSSAAPMGTTDPTGGGTTGGTTGGTPGTGGLPNVPGWLQGITNYALPIAATLYGGMNLSNAYGNAAQQAAAAATGAGTEVNNTATTAAGNIEGAANNAATGVTAAGANASAGVNPYATAGAGAVNSLSQLAANGGFQFNPNNLSTNPTYQFELQQGTQAADRQLASQGLIGSGAAVKDAAQYAQGLASTDLNNLFSQALSGYQTNVNNLQNLAGSGQTASQYQGNTGLTAAQGAGTFGYQGALEGGDFGLQGSSYQGNANTGAGLDLAAGTVGAGNAQAIMANQIANILMAPQQNGQMNLSQILAGLFNGGGGGSNG